MVYTSRDGQAFGAILMQDLAVDDSNKPLLVGSALEVAGPIEILGVRVELTTTIAGGNRQLSIRLEDSNSGDVAGQWDALTVVIASQTDQFHEFMPGRVAGTVAGQFYEYLPFALIVNNGQTLRVFDSAEIAVAADDMIVHIRARKPII